MPVVYLLLLLASAILFFLAMIGLPSSARFNMVAAGLLCWVAVFVIKAAVGFH